MATIGEAPRSLISVIAVLGIVGASCSSGDREPAATSPATEAPRFPSASGEVVVFAASSLTEAFTEVGDAFEAENPDAVVAFNFAGSGDLVTQITQGAPADVFVSADAANMTRLTDAGENVGDPISIARNTMEIIVEKGNPKDITGLADLAKSDLIVVLCAETVPCGKSAAKILETAGVTVAPRSLEDKVKGVVTKVTAGEADAGIVFVTDVMAVGDAAVGVDIPADVNVTNDYPIVMIKEAPNPEAARVFIDFVASAAGQAILVEFGFLAT